MPAALASRMDSATSPLRLPINTSTATIAATATAEAVIAGQGVLVRCDARGFGDGEEDTDRDAQQNRAGEFGSARRLARRRRPYDECEQQVGREHRSDGRDRPELQR